MFPYLGFSIALVGSTVAGIMDLKTTEIPDEVSLGMVFSGLLLHLMWSVVERNPIYIFSSAAVGSVFFTFSLLMYLGGQWGGGDAKVLTGLGTLLPSAPIFASPDLVVPFSLVLVLNIFFVGAAYMLVYSVGLTVIKRKVWKDFLQKVRKKWKKNIIMSLIPIILILFLTVITGWGPHIIPLILLIPTILLLLLLSKFLKSVEEIGFMKEVDTESLRPGDMLSEEIEEIDSTHDPIEELGYISKLLTSFALLPVSMYILGASESIYFLMSLPAPVLGLVLGFLRYTYYHTQDLLEPVFGQSSTRVRGLEREEVEKIRDKYDTVGIREGVRFAPVFPIAVIVTVYYGNLLLLFL